MGNQRLGNNKKKLHTLKVASLYASYTEISSNLNLHQLFKWMPKILHQMIKDVPTEIIMTIVNRAMWNYKLMRGIGVGVER